MRENRDGEDSVGVESGPENVNERWRVSGGSESDGNGGESERGSEDERVRAKGKVGRREGKREKQEVSSSFLPFLSFLRSSVSK